MIINVVCLGTVHLAQRNRRGGGERPFGGGADLTHVGGPIDVEVDAPNQLKEGPVHRLGYPERDASRIS